MTKRGRQEPEQLSLNFSSQCDDSLKFDAELLSGLNIVTFVDATTLALRREAIRRVKNAGIFAAPEWSTRLKG